MVNHNPRYHIRAKYICSFYGILTGCYGILGSLLGSMFVFSCVVYMNGRMARQVESKSYQPGSMWTRQCPSYRRACKKKQPSPQSLVSHLFHISHSTTHLQHNNNTTQHNNNTTQHNNITTQHNNTTQQTQTYSTVLHSTAQRHINAQ